MYIITCNVVKHHKNKLVPVITYFYKHSLATHVTKKLEISPTRSLAMYV